VIDSIIGSRRYFWIFPNDLEYEYKPNDAHFEIKFFLPKGGYATNLIEEIKGSS
jgi:tRNA pseudouridine13 synthase